MDSNQETIDNQSAENSREGVASRSPSVLFPDAGPHRLTKEPPACFHDLNLDQVVEVMVTGKEAYNLKPYFYTPLGDIDSIEYRHEVMREVEDAGLLDHMRHFAQDMSALREQSERASKLSTIYQKQAWFLELVEFYCRMTRSLADGLGSAPIQSRGLLRLQKYLANYLNSEAFLALQQESEALRADLADIRYCLHMRDLSLTVTKYDAQSDYSAEVERTFEKFKQGAVKNYRVRLPDFPYMNQVEEMVIEFVARIHPEVFERVADFCRAHDNYADDVVLRFDREIQFYIAYLEYIANLKEAGLPLCYPELSAESKEVRCRGAYDLALASKLVNEQRPVVCNDFDLTGSERILVVSGPNQGGKTTFARTFGQMHFLARLGCRVPGSEARLFHSDQLLTHFEKEEAIGNLRGKLQDDLVRIHDILAMATPDSIVILNEIFTSTTIQDATWLSRKMMEQLAALDCLGVWVTFIDELSAFGSRTVSMVSAVAPDDRTVRTFKIERRPADGLAYALSLAEKYGLDEQSLARRLA